MIGATYVLPIATTEDVEELAEYLRDLVEVIDQVVVVDGSPEDHVRRHRELFPDSIELCPPTERTLNGKVGGVNTGVELARHDAVVIADDDVRYPPAALARLVALLDDADLVRPQNHFEPRPWHAVVDSSRTLLNRLAGGDWPGTMAVRRSTFLEAGGCSGDVMFDNLDLVRAIRSIGGRDIAPLDLYVPRRPPTSRHFRTQQIRQAYDELARPWRLLPMLAVAPATVLAIGRRAVGSLATGAVVVAGLAEAGRRRGGAQPHFSALAPLVAPVWLVWRSLCTWAALGAWARGGVRYRGQRLRRATRTSAISGWRGQRRRRAARRTA